MLINVPLNVYVIRCFLTQFQCSDDKFFGLSLILYCNLFLYNVIVIPASYVLLVLGFCWSVEFSFGSGLSVVILWPYAIWMLRHFAQLLFLWNMEFLTSWLCSWLLGNWCSPHRHFKCPFSWCNWITVLVSKIKSRLLFFLWGKVHNSKLFGTNTVCSFFYFCLNRLIM